MYFIGLINIIWTLFLSFGRCQDNAESHPIYFNNYHYTLKDILNDLEWSIHKQTDNETISCDRQIPLLCIQVDTKQTVPNLKLTYDQNKLSFDFMDNDNWDEINILKEMNDVNIKIQDINIERRRMQSRGIGGMRGIGGDFRELRDELTDGLRKAMPRRRGRSRSRSRRRRRRRRRRPRRHRFGGYLRAIRKGLCGANRCMDGGFKNPCMNSMLSNVLFGYILRKYIYRLVCIELVN